MKALLVIDVQQGVCHDLMHDVKSVIDRINHVADKARSAGVPVIFIQHESERYLPHGSHEWQLADGLRVEKGDMKVRKKTPDSFHKTGLNEVLKGLDVNELIICGLQTDFCVDTTTRRALAHGFPVALIEDAHTTEGNSVLSAVQIINHHNRTLQNMESFGPRVTTVKAAEIEFRTLP